MVRVALAVICNSLLSWILVLASFLTGIGFHDFLAGCSVQTIEQSCKALQIQGLALKLCI